MKVAIYFVVSIKSNFGEVAVDMFTFAVVSLSPNQAIVFCVIKVELSTVAYRSIKISNVSLSYVIAGQVYIASYCRLVNKCRLFD